MKKILGLVVLSLFFQGTLRAEVPAAADAPAVAVTANQPVSSVEGSADAISVEFNEADIQSVLKILALKGNVNIVASPDVQGKVTMQLKDVPWLSAFETIVKTYGYSYERKGNIYQILTPESLKARQEESAVLLREVFTLDYAAIDQVSAALKKTLSKTALVEPIAGTNQMVITDQASNMEAVKNLISRIDTKLPQVHIETKIVRTTLSSGEQMGINWNPQVELRGAKRPVTTPFTTKLPMHGIFNKYFQNQSPIGNTKNCLSFFVVNYLREYAFV